MNHQTSDWAPPRGEVAPASLRHEVVDGPTTNALLRAGPVAAHLVLTGGALPRLLMAFSAGNSGMALWFEHTRHAVSWRLLREMTAISETDAQGRRLHGVEAELACDGASLVLRQALLGSVRVLRDHQHDSSLPALGIVTPRVEAGNARWARDRLDGAPGYVLSIEVLAGSMERLGAHRLALIGPGGGTPLRLKLRALTGDAPLAPWDANELLTDDAADLPSARRSLLFLSYREALLAGSWRFQTYFGRDTLMTVRLLMPVLQPSGIEAALASVLCRLSPDGEVAHEESIGEWPILTRLTQGAAPLATPIRDYKMIDDDFMLLPVVAAYLLEHAPGRARAASFLAQRVDGAGGDTDPTIGSLLMRNIARVLSSARAFAEQPLAAALIHLKPGALVGDWRDSEEGLGGLGGGVVPYSVNVVLVPAALRAIDALAAAGLLTPYDGRPARFGIERAARWAERWETHAPPLFAVSVGATTAARAIDHYAAEQQVPSVPSPGEVTFSALSLDAAGRPVPVMHCDFSFALLLSDPSAQVLERELATLMGPFPAGLMTDVGLLVANAVFAGPALQTMFGPDRYHGAVVWSWQQAMVAAGLERQLARTELPATTRAILRQAQTALWQTIAATRALADGELWSWTHDGTRYVARPFGLVSNTADESNAAQLWSCVYLAVKPPAAAAAEGCVA